MKERRNRKKEKMAKAAQGWEAVEVLEVGVGEEEEEELLRGTYSVSVVHLVEEEGRRRAATEGERKELSRAEAVEKLKNVVPEYEERLGLASKWDEETQDWSQESFGKPVEVEKCVAMWEFWRRWGFSEGLMESAKRSGTGAGRRLMGAPKGREAKDEQLWTKMLKNWRKQFARIMRAAGCTNEVVDAVFAAAVRFQESRPMTIEDVDLPEGVEREERREGGGGGGEVAGVEEVEAGATGGTATADTGVITPVNMNEEIAMQWQSKGIKSVITIPVKSKNAEKTLSNKPESLMENLVRPPLPKLPRLQPSASNPPIIKKTIDNPGRIVDFRPTSAQRLLPATARRHFDHRNDTISGVVSTGYHPVTGLEEFRVHLGTNDDVKGNDYLMIEEGDEETRRRERKELREELRKQKNKTDQLARNLDRWEKRSKKSGKDKRL